MNKVSKAHEDLWFSKNEQKIIERLKAKHDEEQERIAKEQKQIKERELKEQHWMKCPKCGHNLKMEHIDDVELDKCENCHGIYFDAGELDVILLKKEEKRKGFFKKILKLEMKGLI